MLSKVYRGGSTGLVVSIGRNIREVYNIENGDTVELELIKVIKAKKKEKLKDVFEESKEKVYSFDDNDNVVRRSVS